MNGIAEESDGLSDEQPKRPSSPNVLALLRSVVVGAAWVAAIVVPFVIFFVFVIEGRDPISIPLNEVVIVSPDEEDRDWHPKPPADRYEHPAAQRLLEIGKALVLHPERRDRPARDLNIMAGRPELLSHDQTAFLSVRIAYWQLRNSPDPYASVEVAQLLWDAADGLEKRQQTVADAEGGSPRSRPH